jgi:hypothetical protein
VIESRKRTADHPKKCLWDGGADGFQKLSRLFKEPNGTGRPDPYEANVFSLGMRGGGIRTHIHARGNHFHPATPASA